MKVLAGIDIGGTKCAISFATAAGEEVTIHKKEVFETLKDEPQKAVRHFQERIGQMLLENPQWDLQAIGISCGGPLDSRKGLILSPPNLPAWDQIDCITPLKEKFHVPVGLQNDADACALAEWNWGAGKGTENMIFLTFGTGMGAGLILDGKLYLGAGNMAGEVGHIRMEEDGPYGYGKYGSFEGFCSGGGIADMGRCMAEAAIDRGNPPLFCKDKESLKTVTAKTIADALDAGDALAREIYLKTAYYLGRGISLLIDILNPEMIVIGSIYGRQQELLEREIRRVIEKEALPFSAKLCRIVPAGLGEMVGDYASISVARSVSFS